MEKLSADNIQFIDTYLKKSGVEYVDIRAEMVDHVASEIEARQANGDAGEFYDLFKVYMRKNKKSLLEGMKKNRKEADRKVFKQVFRNLYHPICVVMGILLSLISLWLVQFFNLNPFNIQVFHLVFMMFLFVVPFWWSRKTKYSSINGVIHCGWFLYFLVVINDSFFEIYNFWYFLMLFIYEVALFKTLLELRTYYRNKYSAV